MIAFACRASISLRAFPGGDADLEPDLDPARPFPLAHIIADHPPIRQIFQVNYRGDFPGFPRAFPDPFPALSYSAMHVHFRGVSPGRGRAVARAGPSRHRRPPAGVRAARRRSRWSAPPDERPGPAAGGVLGLPWPAGTGWTPPTPARYGGRALRGPWSIPEPEAPPEAPLFSPFGRGCQVPAAGQHEPQDQPADVGGRGGGAGDQLQHRQGQHRGDGGAEEQAARAAAADPGRELPAPRPADAAAGRRAPRRRRGWRAAARWAPPRPVPACWSRSA